MSTATINALAEPGKLARYIGEPTSQLQYGMVGSVTERENPSQVNFAPMGGPYQDRIYIVPVGDIQFIDTNDFNQTPM
jgi:hypothetical protein